MRRRTPLKNKRYLSVVIATALAATSLVLIAPPSGAATPKCFGKKATKVGTAEDDTISGTKRADVIVAKGGNDFVFGGGGNDLICLGGGGDVAVAQAGRDKVSGGAGDDTIHPGPGNDNVNGNLGTNWIAYLFSTTGVTVNLTTGKATGEGTDTFSNIANVTASSFEDTVLGSSATNLVLAGPGNDFVVGGTTSTSGTEDLTDIIDGGDGDDEISGGDGFDMISFQSMEADPAAPCTAGVDVDLGQGTALGQGTDTFESVEAAWGSNLSDVIRGNSGNNFLVGSLCDDDIRGGGGFDYAIFWFAAGPVNASLDTGVATGEGNDTLANDVEALFGSIIGNDTLTGDNRDNFIGGDAGNDTIDGGGGDDWLQGGAGNDSIEGGAGNYDLADFSTSTGPVTGSLTAGSASGDGNDTLANLEAFYGSLFNDNLTGNDDANFLFGDFGADQIDGGLGKDEIDGGPDTDVATGGGGGNDTCANVEQVAQCSSVASITTHPLMTAAQAVAAFRRSF